MARKTTENGTTNRRKKIGPSVQPAQPAAAQVAPEVPKSGKPTNLVPVNLEEEIRLRAYELYQQRKGTPGAETGNKDQDWLIAEREIRTRYGSQERRTAKLAVGASAR